MKNFLSHPCTSFRALPFSGPRSRCYLFARPTSLATLLITVCFNGIAFAQDDNSDRNWNLGLAVGYGERSNPLVTGEDIDINTVIDFSWTGNRFYFDNGDFGYYFLERKSYAFNLVATVNNERNYYNYLTGRQLGLDSVVGANFNKTLMPAPPENEEKPKDQNMFVSQEDQAAIPGLPETVSPSFLNQNTDLPDRDFAVNSGIEFLYISPWGDIQAQLLSDVSSTHNGQEAWLSWSHPWYTANSELNLTFGLEWKSADLVSYYYGVRPDEAFRGRDVYTANAGTNRFIRLAARHNLSRHWNLVAMIEREFLSSAIYESPIVSSHEVDTFFTGLFYQF